MIEFGLQRQIEILIFACRTTVSPSSVVSVFSVSDALGQLWSEIIK